jgi:predicted GNAT family N-acyltransferase
MIEFYQKLFKFFEEGGKSKTAAGRQFIPVSREFSCAEMTVYVRATPRVNHETHQYEKALVIARVDVQPEFRGKKYFRDFMKHMDAQAYANGYAAIYVDQVHSDVLKECLPRYGFIRCTSTAPGERIYRKAVRVDVAEDIQARMPEEPAEEPMWMIRENRTMQYVAFVSKYEVGVTKEGRKAMHFRSEEIADHQALILTRQSVEHNVYKAVIAQTSALP